jgi:hypothetical protein
VAISYLIECITTPLKDTRLPRLNALAFRLAMTGKLLLAICEKAKFRTFPLKLIAYSLKLKRGVKNEILERRR